MNVCFKKAVICFCIIGLLFGSLRPYRANAIAVVDDCIVIGGVLVTTYVVVLALEKSGAFEGFNVNDDYSGDVRNYLSKKILALSAAEIAKYFFTAKDDAGNDYVGVTDSGTTYSREELKELFNIEVNNFPAATTKTTDNTAPTPTAPTAYMKNGIYMTPLKMVSGLVVAPILVKAGDSITYQVYSSYTGKYYSTSRTCGSDTYIRIYHYEHEVYIEGSFDSSFSSPSSFAYCNWCDNGYEFDYGYKTTSNTVYVPGNQVISQDTPIDKPADAVVAVPISGQYDSSTGRTIYDGIDGGVATAVTGLKAVDLSTDANTGANAGTDTQTGFWDKLWDWLKEIIDGIESIPHLILDWFTIDWDKVKTHINYIDIVKQHFQPIYDIFDLISNVSADIKDSDGKFYMVIPHEMGGDDKEHCVLDLSVGAVYITTARDVIKYGMWMGFVWYVLRKFDPKFSI